MVSWMSDKGLMKVSDELVVRRAYAFNSALFA